MTREDFEEDIRDFYDLRNLCNEYDCSICEEIYDREEFNDTMDSRFYDDYYRGDHWEDVLYDLQCVSDLGDCDWYAEDDNGDFIDITDEFEDYKDDVRSWLEDGEFFDDEDDEDDEETDVEEESEDNEEDEDIDVVPVSEFLDYCEEEIKENFIRNSTKVCPKEVEEEMDTESLVKFLAV